jgi:hypothetical protein
MPLGAAANRAGFTPDLAGTYTASLTVVNPVGLESPPCTASLEAVPTDALWIEMYWQQAGDDMDLHLVRADGELETSNDCYYANCSSTWTRLDWGERGDETDDPELALDDIPGTGPEVIAIEAPEAATFTAYVQDFAGSVYEGENDVTMNVYVDGARVWTDTRDVDEEGASVPFVEVDWRDGTLTAL